MGCLVGLRTSKGAMVAGRVKGGEDEVRHRALDASPSDTESSGGF